MKTEEKTFFSNIMLLIDKEEYAKAENELDLIVSDRKYSEESISYAYYLIGYINTCWRNENKQKYVAKLMLLKNIESDFPRPESYFFYAEQEKDKNVSMNYLRAGLSKFPNSSSIYLGLLRYCSEKEKIIYINEIDNKNIINANLLNKVIEILISTADWNKVEIFTEKLLKEISITDYDRLYHGMVYSFSLVIQDKNIEKARKSFLEIIEKDLANKLKYAPYMGYIWCCVKIALFEEAVKYFDKIPFFNGLEDLIDGPWCIILIDFQNIYECIFRDMASVLKSDKQRILRLAALQAYYLYMPSESYGNYRYGKKHLRTLKRYLKTDVKNLDVACAIFNMQVNFHLFFDAYKTHIAMLCEFLNPEEKGINDIDFWEKLSPMEAERIYQDILSTLISDVDMDFDGFVSGIFDYIVDYLYKSNLEDKHKKICALADAINDYCLSKSEKLFEIAYSYAEVDNRSEQAEKIYLRILNSEDKNSSVMNNLGVIYKNRNNFQKAQEYFTKAHELNSNYDKYKNNLKMIMSSIREKEKTLNNIQKENVWFLGRVSKVYESANPAGEVICTYKERPALLSVSPQKANELFDKMCKNGYLKKIAQNSSQSPSKYVINPYINEYLLQEKEKIVENEFYELLGQKLNLNEMIKIGYTKKLQDLVDNIDNVDLRDILQRDLRECAISLLINQYKACIVICGSIIEAILVDKIEGRGISEYAIGTLPNNKLKKKTVRKMDLNELLELARAEKIVDTEEYHLSNYVRSYRNIIHPYCEVRKNFNVDENTAKLMWSALLAIINELLK